MSEEAFNEIVDGFEYIRTLTEWGSKNIKQHIQRLQQENKYQKEIIDERINAIDLVIELIKQQPTKDDRWILDRLNGFKIILEYKEVSE